MKPETNTIFVKGCPATVPPSDRAEQIGCSPSPAMAT
nr:MAG TPA: hypothetical protein [Caudoviricetes sp.]DAU37794.1 MAG TPA: hypothetical protein [Caudoviricetes sp.]DAV74504.1 MAG TPA: hypothetical protein [Caudoviricetes sp.]